MASSPLLKLVRDSILEVYQVRRIIDYEKVTQEYPVLAEPLNCQVNIYLNEKLRSSFKTSNTKPLAENIIYCAKKAAFEDPSNPPLKTTEYLHCVVELTLFRENGAISQKDTPILQEE